MRPPAAHATTSPAPSRRVPDSGTSRSDSFLSVDEARLWIIGRLRPLAAEIVALDAAPGRVVAADVMARLASPPADVSAMDGYAILSTDTQQPSARLRLIGESRAGRPSDGIVAAGTCMRIFTGAVLPVGADAVIVQENAVADGGYVSFGAAAGAGHNVRRAGLDFAAGDPCLPRGRRLGARDIGLAAAAGHGEVRVHRRPRVALLSTGDELVPAGRLPGAGQIVDANRPALLAAIRAWGGEPLDLGIAADHPEEIAARIDGAQADMLIITGGASVGDHDQVHTGLERLGLVQDFWKIRMKPGKPLMFGRLGDVPVLSLPGNPVSALVTALLFVRPAMAALEGSDPAEPVFERVRLAGMLPRNGDREDYVRARLATDGEGYPCVEPFPTQDSAMLRTLAHADALIRRLPFAPAAEPGDAVDILRLEAGIGL